MWHMFYGLFYMYNTIVMVFYQFEPIWMNLDTRSGQGQVKKGQILKFDCVA